MDEPALPDDHLAAHPDVDVTPPGTGAPMIVDAADGLHVLGAPSADSDLDGRPDTVVVEPTTGDATMLLATDVDGDAHADVVTLVDADGAVTTTLRGPDGTLPVPAWDPGWDDGGPAAPPAPYLDPVTGVWTRSG